jgi:GntR family transcriptional regulator
MRKLDRGSPIPLYYQLQEILEQEINSGLWKAGELLPSEAEMTARFGVSRSVTRKTLDNLELNGQVYRVNGKGTVVAQPKHRYEAIGAAARWGSTDDDEPIVSRVVVAQSTSAGGHVGRLLELSPAADVYELAYVQSVEGSPASLTHMFLHPGATEELRNGVPKLLEGEAAALVQLEQRYGLTLIETSLSIEATHVNEFEAEMLDIAAGSAAFILNSVEIGTSGGAVAFSSSVVRMDHFRFTARVRQPKALRSRA